MHCVIVSHFHWDREWYRTFQAFRARLVDAVDRVLDLLATDPQYRFLFDGQTVLLEDYLAVRPDRRGDLERVVREGRVSIGPWYVQPDALLPCGEAHVRNLLRGRRVGRTFGPVSRVGYVPDSFGHPAQVPQLLAGFGMTTFVYWRGNGDEIDDLGPRYRWVAPDGSAVEATLLAEGYFNAAGLPVDADDGARRLADVVRRMSTDPARPVLLMNGVDHMLPDPHVGTVAAQLARQTGWTVQCGLLEDAVGDGGPDLPTYTGELCGGRLANLLPGVWSTHMALKLLNRRCETLLAGWLEPWMALGRHLGAPDEHAALDLAWRAVLRNQAHDSLCGCSLDAVIDAVRGRFAAAEGLAEETLSRILERLAGRGIERQTPWQVEQDIVVFNPSPHPRTDVVRVPVEPYPPLRISLGAPDVAPLALAAMDVPGFEVDGHPARVVPSEDVRRPRWLPGQQPFDVEFVAADVPALGCRRFRITPTARHAEVVDDGRDIGAGAVSVLVADDGTATVRFGAAQYRGVLAVDDTGDRGDSYDYDPVADDPGARLASMSCRRIRDASGLARLEVERTFWVPRELAPDRARRTSDAVLLRVWTEMAVAPGVPRVDVRVRVDNPARDHRVRLLFPTGVPAATCLAATTYDVVERSTAARDGTRWVHPATATFPHQGWVAANGLTVVAPGLPEAEVTPDGCIAITVLRAVGWLSRFDLRSRPTPAGPMMPLPGAQVPGVLDARLSLLAGADPVAAWDAELGLRGVIGGAPPLLDAGRALLALEPSTLLLSAVKPADDGTGIVVRVLNPSDASVRATLRLGFDVRSADALRLDEEPAAHDVVADAGHVSFDVPPHALRSVRLR